MASASAGSSRSVGMKSCDQRTDDLQELKTRT
jgi:hypothetical protein